MEFVTYEGVLACVCVCVNVYMFVSKARFSIGEIGLQSENA